MTTRKSSARHNFRPYHVKIIHHEENSTYPARFPGYRRRDQPGDSRVSDYPWRGNVAILHGDHTAADRTAHQRIRRAIADARTVDRRNRPRELLHVHLPTLRWNDPQLPGTHPAGH